MYKHYYTHSTRMTDLNSLSKEELIERLEKQTNKTSCEWCSKEFKQIKTHKCKVQREMLRAKRIQEAQLEAKIMQVEAERLRICKENLDTELDSFAIDHPRMVELIRSMFEKIQYLSNELDDHRQEDW